MRDARAPPAQNFFIFMQFLRKIGQIIGWRPLFGVSAPSSGKSWFRYWERHPTPPPPPMDIGFSNVRGPFCAPFRRRLFCTFLDIEHSRSVQFRNCTVGRSYKFQNSFFFLRRGGGNFLDYGGGLYTLVYEYRRKLSGHAVSKTVYSENIYPSWLHKTYTKKETVQRRLGAGVKGVLHEKIILVFFPGPSNSCLN